MDMFVALYNTERLAAAQGALLDTLLVIDGLCRKHGITYMLDSGTLLGAVRHKGFIPWDDDCDIAMTRENYDRFLEVVSELPEGWHFLPPRELAESGKFFDFTGRVIYENSKTRLWSEEIEYYEGKLDHLWVDIFILDNISDNAVSDRKTRLSQKILYGYAMAKRYGIDYDKYSGLEKAEVKILTGAGRKKVMTDLIDRQEKLSRKWNGKETKRLYYSNYQPDYLHCTVDRSWIGQPVELPFEGHMLLCPENYDAVLTEIYGDYMTLPPEEKRVPSHSDNIEVFKDGKPEPIVYRR